jgi:nicotinate phosphoribosyltransferase
MVTKRPSALLTDLYQLNMDQAYLEHGETATAVFEFFVRNLPPRRGFLLAAGLEQTLDFLENLRFSAEEIAWLKDTGRFGKDLLDYLTGFRFSGDIHAMPEGTVFFANEPIVRVTAPMPQAQLAESRLINILHFQTLIASKAARMMFAAPGKTIVDFGMRRAHGAEAGVMAARASYIAGFAGTATVLAGKEFGIPIFGTMAHSFVEAFDDETAAFAAFAQSRPDNLVLLIDTYDIEAAAHKVVALAPRLKAKGITIRGVRLDSGDLAMLSRKVRRILDAGGAQRRHHLRQRRPRRRSACGADKRSGADRRIWRRHKPDDVVGRADARLRLQAAGICRLAATQALGKESHLAGTKAGVAALRRRRPDGRRCCRPRRR